MQIKIIGPGCAKCNETERIVREVVAEKGLQAEIEKVTDMLQMMTYGVLSTPAVIIDGEVKVSGIVPTKQAVLGWFEVGGSKLYFENS